MMLTGKPIDAREAYRVGLVNEVVPPDQLMPVAERWAAEIIECAPLAVRGSKQAALVGLDAPTLGEAIGGTYEEVQRHMRSADRVEGPRAFSESRAPNWTGAQS